MNSTRSPLVAGLLAIALVAVTVPFVPSGSADGTDQSTCEKSGTTLIEDWDGYVAITHPAISNVRVSEALYFFVFQDDFTVLGSSLQQWMNGQDAYVAHFGCNTASNDDYCLERDAVDEGEDFPLLTFRADGQEPDIRVQFYGPTLNTLANHDPDVPAKGEYCTFDDASNDGAPGGAHYAVIYLDSGHPIGIQRADDAPGPYTEDFLFELHRP